MIMLLLIGTIISLPAYSGQTEKNNSTKKDEHLDILITSIGKILQQKTECHNTPQATPIHTPEAAAIMESFVDLCDIQSITNKTEHFHITNCLKTALQTTASYPISIAVKKVSIKNILRNEAEIPLEIIITNNQNYDIEITEDIVKQSYSPLTFLKYVAASIGALIVRNLTIKDYTTRFLLNTITAACLITTMVQLIFLIDKYFPKIPKIKLSAHESKSIIVYIDLQDINKIPNEIIRSPEFTYFTNELLNENASKNFFRRP